MTFKLVFAYALFRGLLDYLTGRPNLQKRLEAVYVKRAMRTTNRLLVQFQLRTRGLEAAMHNMSKSAQILEKRWRGEA